MLHLCRCMHAPNSYTLGMHSLHQHLKQRTLFCVHTGLLHLERLDLGWCTSITDLDIQAVGQLTQLQDLQLSGTCVSDRGLASLQGLPKLRRVGLRGTRVTAAGLAFVTGLQKLESLNLASTSVGSQGEQSNRHASTLTCRTAVLHKQLLAALHTCQAAIMQLHWVGSCIPGLTSRLACTGLADFTMICTDCIGTKALPHNTCRSIAMC